LKTQNTHLLDACVCVKVCVAIPIGAKNIIIYIIYETENEAMTRACIDIKLGFYPYAAALVEGLYLE
jgi:hypothetical protein